MKVNEQSLSDRTAGGSGPRVAAASAARPTALAAVLRGGQVGIDSVDLPTPGNGELLVSIDLATVCGVDRAAVASSDGDERILGHEGVGRVVAADSAAPAAVGDRIVWGPAVACGRCDRCRSGRSAACRRLRRIGDQPFDGPWQLSGAFSTHLLLPRGAAVATVPAELPDTVAAGAGCSAATIMSALDATGPLRGARVLICGAGMLGLTAAAIANDRGASAVVVVDHDAARRTLARSFGATETVGQATDTDPLCLPDTDVALEFSGSESLATTALNALTIGGRLVLVSARGAQSTLRVDIDRAVTRWHTVTGVHGSEPRHLSEAISYLTEAQSRWPWEQLVSPAMPLSYLPTLLTQPAPIAPRTAIQPRR